MGKRTSRTHSWFWDDPAMLRQALAESATTRQAILWAGLTVSQAVYKRFERACTRHNIPIVFGKEYVRVNLIPDEKIFIENSKYINNAVPLKERILAGGILENRCSECGIGPHWNGQPLTLQLDHINGISNDHRYENLRILCPNCHTQTPTFSGRRHNNYGKGTRKSSHRHPSGSLPLPGA